MKSARQYLLQLKTAQAETAKHLSKPLRSVRSRLHGTVQLNDNPADHRSNRFLQQRTATLADRRQSHRSPSTHLRFIQFPYQKTVRQPCLPEWGHVGVAGLPQVSAKQTSSQSPKKKTRLLSISVRISEIPRFRARPTTSIRFDNPLRVPVNLIRCENLSRLRVVFAVNFTGSQDHDADLVVDVRHLHAHAQIPLLHAVNRHRLAVARRDRLRELDRLSFDALERNLAIELQVADVAAFRFVFEQRGEKPVDRVLHDFRGLDDWHGTPFPVTRNIFRRSPDRSNRQFYKSSINFAKV